MSRWQSALVLALVVVCSIAPGQERERPREGEGRREGERPAQGHERGRRVVARRGDALLAALHDVADRAVLLEAVAQGLAPEVALVDVHAARVQAHVAAQGAHAAQLRAGDQAGGLGQGRGALPDLLGGGDLVDALPIAQSTISQHLKILKGAGLVVGEIDGPRRCYCVAPDALARLKAGIAAL